MLCIAALFLLFSVVLGGYAPHYDLEHAKDYFHEFIGKYDKDYANAQEYHMRFQIFQRNLMKYNEWNKKLQSHKGGHVITKFSDQTGHQSCLNWSQMRNTTKLIKLKNELLQNLPESLDYRKQNLVTGVKDQRECMSCYDFAAIANIEGMYAKKTGKLISLSEQQGLDCARGDCKHGGRPQEVIEDLAKQGGIESEEDYPYEGVKETCRADKKKLKVKVIEGHIINTPDVDSLKAALVQNGAPLSITLYATDTMMSAHGRVILDPEDCNNEDANHAVLLVGYDVDKDSGKTYWIMKNSWGPDLGDHGYYYFDVNNRCSVGKEMTVTSTVE